MYWSIVRKHIFSVLFLIAIASVFAIQNMVLAYRTVVFHSVSQVPSAPVALVFGAGVNIDGSPTDSLRDRVLTGVELYKSGKVRKIVMTGDNGTRYHDEVTPMRNLAIEEGVPSDDVIGDYAGFRTYESCYRARDVFGLSSVIAVSQNYHLPRILYICNSMRVNAVGVSADRGQYADMYWSETREFLARLKAWWQVEITKPLPRYLGEKEKVFAV
jgi:vancomycin permeability regulator SanA